MTPVKSRRSHLAAPRPIRIQSAAAIVTLAAIVVTSVAVIPASRRILHVLLETPVVESTLESAEAGLMLVNAVQAFTTLAGAVAFLAFWYGGLLNLRRFGLKGVRTQPGMGVLLWFVPVVNFVMVPMTGVELLRGSRAAAAGDVERGWRERGGGLLVWIWWVAFVSIGVLDFVAVQRIADARLVGTELDLIRAFRFRTYAVLARVVAAGLAIALVVRVTRWQTTALENATVEGEPDTDF